MVPIPRFGRVVLALTGLAVLQGALFLAYRTREAEQGARGGVHVEEVRGSIQAPPVRVERVDGHVDRISSAGTPTLVHFWATWCPPCRQELPRLIEFARSRGVRLVAIAADPGWDPIRTFFGGKIPPEIVREAEGGTHRAYGVTTLPDTYFVGSDGRLLLRFAGAQDWSAREVAERLNLTQ